MRKIAGLILAVLVPLCLFLNWKSADAQYPNNDEGFYFVITQELYNNFKTMDVSSAVSEIYFHRHWKPILHPVLALPFLAFAGGDVRWAVMMYGAFIYLVLLTIVYLYLDRYLRRESAVLGTLMISLIPWIFGTMTTFNSEATFVTAALGFFYCLSGNFDLSQKKKSLVAAAWLGLMLCLRPVEAGLLFSVPIAGLIAFSYFKKTVSRRDIAVLFFWFIFCAGVIVPPCFVFEEEWGRSRIILFDLLSAGAFGWIMLYAEKMRLNKGFQIFIGVAFFTLIFWYAPGARTLFDWVLVANFKYMAITTGNRAGKPVWEFVTFYLSKLGMIPWFLTVISVAVYRFQKTEIIKNLILLIGLLLVPLIAGVASYNGDVRYYYGGWAIVTLLLLRYALDHKVRFYKIRWGILFFASTLLFLNMWKPRVAEEYQYSQYLGKSFFSLTSKKTEPLKATYETLLHLLKPEKVSVSFYFLTKNMFPHQIDHWGLRLMAGENGKYWEFHNPFYYSPDNVAFLETKATHYDYVLVGPFEDDWSDIENAVATLSRKFLAICTGAQPADPNYQLIGKFQAESASGSRGTNCLFLNLKKPDTLIKRYSY